MNTTSLIQSLRRNAAIAGVVTNFALVTFLGFLWLAATLNSGYTPPRAFVVPTHWLAAFVGLYALTTLFAFLAYLRAGTPESAASEDTATESSQETPADPEHTRETDATTTQSRRTGAVVDVGEDSSATSSRESQSAEVVASRADENFPNDLNDEGNEYPGQTNEAPRSSAPRSTGVSGNQEMQADSPDQASSVSNRSERPAPSSDPSESDGDTEEQTSDESRSLPGSYYRNLRTRIVHDAFRR